MAHNCEPSDTRAEISRTCDYVRLSGSFSPVSTASMGVAEVTGRVAVPDRSNSGGLPQSHYRYQPMQTTELQTWKFRILGDRSHVTGRSGGCRNRESNTIDHQSSNSAGDATTSPS